MANKRKIESPGVQIGEIDLSLRPVVNASTTIYIPGFSPRGPVEDAVRVSSLSEFEQIYGVPTNAAERYFYNSVKATFQSPADILVTRLPYGSGSGGTVSDNVGLLAYPAKYVALSGTTVASSSAYSLSSGVYVLGAPMHYTLNQDDYTKFLNGTLFTFTNSTSGSLTSAISTLGDAAFIIINQSQTSVNQAFEGLYVGIIDNTNINDTTDYENITKVLTLNTSAAYVSSNNYLVLPTARLDTTNYALTGSTVSGPDDSVSQIMENIPSFTINSGTRDFDDTIMIGVFKLRQSVFAGNVIQLAPTLVESYVGSFDSHRLINNSNGGPATSFFIEDIISNASTNIAVKVNPFLSRYSVGNGYAGGDGTPLVKIRVNNPALTASNLYATNLPATSAANIGNRNTVIGFSADACFTSLNSTISTSDGLNPVGAYQAVDLSTKNVGNVPAKLQRIFDRFYNSDIYPFDIAIEAGLGSVYACAQMNSASLGIFDDFIYTDMGALSSSNLTSVPTVVGYYRAVLNTLVNLAENPARKDCLVIADPLIPILVQSNTLKTIDDPSKNFAQHVLTPLQNVYSSYNTSYATVFGTCVKVSDVTSGRQVWVPFSGYAAAAMGNTDNDFQPWYAPAGFTRGIIRDVIDIAYYPRQTQRDQLYKNSINPVAFFPSEGFVIYGQKTLLKKPSAFDRVNVRRLFLSLEKATRDTLKFFVFEPNTLLTRTQVVNTLTPIFDNAKNTQGVYDYLIICDERNNTPSVIDDNTMIVDIYIKPVRTAEFILANFYATRTGVNFQEIVG